MSGSAGSTDAAFDGAGLAGPLSVSKFWAETSGSHKQIPAKLRGSRFADSLIHRLSAHFPELTGAVAQRRERNAALCAVQKPGQDFRNVEFTESNFGHVLLFGIR